MSGFERLFSVPKNNKKSLEGRNLRATNKWRIQHVFPTNFQHFFNAYTGKAYTLCINFILTPYPPFYELTYVHLYIIFSSLVRLYTENFYCGIGY